MAGLAIVAVTATGPLRSGVCTIGQACYRARPPGLDSVKAEFEVGSPAGGRTLADVVRNAVGESCSWNRARELCKHGKVRVNGELAADAAQRVRAGDRISVDPDARRRREHVLSENVVIYVDAQFVVVNKPADLL